MVNRKAERKKQCEKENKESKMEVFRMWLAWRRRAWCLAASACCLVASGLVFGGVGLLLGGVGLGVWRRRLVAWHESRGGEISDGKMTEFMGSMISR